MAASNPPPNTKAVLSPLKVNVRTGEPARGQPSRDEYAAFQVAVDATGASFPAQHPNLVPAKVDDPKSSGITQPFDSGVSAVGINTDALRQERGTYSAFEEKPDPGLFGAQVQAAVHEVRHAQANAEAMAASSPQAMIAQQASQESEHAQMARELGSPQAPGYGQSLRQAFNALPSQAQRQALAAGLHTELDRYNEKDAPEKPLLSAAEVVAARQRACSFSHAADSNSPGDHPWMSPAK